MSFLLVKRQTVHFPNDHLRIFEDLVFRKVSVPVQISRIDSLKNALSEKDCLALTRLIQNPDIVKVGNDDPNDTNPSHFFSEDFPPLDNNLQLGLGLTPKTAYNDGKRARVFLKVEKGNVIFQLKEVLEKHNMELKIKLEIENLTSVSVTDGSKTQLVQLLSTGDVDVNDVHAPLMNQAAHFPLFQSTNWRNNKWDPSIGCSYEAVISITGYIVFSTLPFLEILNSNLPPVSGANCINRTILENEINCDASIMSSGGAVVKCHKVFLSVRSPVLKATFKPDYKESKTTCIEMPDMTESGVRAFLSYLYYENTEAAIENSGVAVELLQAGHKYDIPELEAIMTKILLLKPNNCFDVNVAMNLFLFTRNPPEGESLKMKAIKLLQINYSSLKTSPEYTELLKKNPTAAMKLCEYAFQLSSLQ